MKFLVISHAPHMIKSGKIFSYGPFVKEMVLWENFVDEMVVFAPIIPFNEDPINLPYLSTTTKVMPSPSLNFTTYFEVVKSSIKLPVVIAKMFWQMLNADHIHLRSPGNLGLIGCFLQILFPLKKKTAKYAGNWDSKSDQPFTFKVQRIILNSEFFTKNMKALVYGNWPGASKNILPFFTASYSKTEILELKKALPEPGDTLNLIFVGSLVSGKNPLLALQSLKLLIDGGHQVHLDVFGSGDQFELLKEFIQKNGLNQFVSLKGNIDAIDLKKEYQKAHFLIFLSDSEGWPKVVAEAMFFGCIPITTSVSCVPDMLGNGERGDLIQKDPQQVVKVIEHYFEHPEEYMYKSAKAKVWSNHYTLELFRSEILKLV